MSVNLFNLNERMINNVFIIHIKFWNIKKIIFKFFDKEKKLDDFSKQFKKYPSTSKLSGDESEKQNESICSDNEELQKIPLSLKEPSNNSPNNIVPLNSDRLIRPIDPSIIIRNKSK